MSVYYSEFDPQAAAWLRELIREGLIPEGDVDERDIRQVQPEDLRGFRQCHFFSGIAGWPFALGLAGVPDLDCWTGSCPCQPFSSAGKRGGTADERHLWPEFLRLIRACRPPVVFGEQVASGDTLGTELEASFVAAVQGGQFDRANKLAERIAKRHARERLEELAPRWVDGVRADLEAEDYAFRFQVLGAHSVGADHIRQRLFWVADAQCQRDGDGGRGAVGEAAEGMQRANRKRQRVRFDFRESCGLELTPGQQAIIDKYGYWPGPCPDFGQRPGECSCGSRGLAHSRRIERERRADEQRPNVSREAVGGEEDAHDQRRGATGGLGVSAGTRDRQMPVSGSPQPSETEGRECGAGGSMPPRGLGDSDDSGSQGRGLRDGQRADERATGEAGGQPASHWADSRTILCRDGKYRRIPTEPGLFPLAHGVSGRLAVVRPGERGAAAVQEEAIRWINRVAALRGAGNAICPQTAAAFIQAFLEVEGR